MLFALLVVDSTNPSSDLINSFLN